MTYSDLLDGKFTYSEALNENFEFVVKTNLDRSDSVRKLFSQVMGLSQYIPKVTSGVNCNVVGFVKIEMVHS